MNSPGQENGMTHAEAYCRMEYKNRVTGQIVVIWNSRDGVTPFCAGIDGVEHQHVNFALDQFQRYWVPEVGDYIFIDCDHDTWKAQEKEHIERDWDHPEYPISKMGLTKEATLVEFMKEFQPGQPMTVQVTQEIHDHFMEKAGNNYNPNQPTERLKPYTGPTRFA